MNFRTALFLACTFIGSPCIAAFETVDLVRIPGIAGPSGSGTAVFRGDLGSLSVAEIRAIRFSDSNSGVGGSPGEFSGFDLDALVISPTFATSATQLNGFTGLDVFDFNPSGTFFTPGTQRPPVDSKLFGTDASGMLVDADFATLDSIDAVYFTSGAVSLGDGGRIAFNLTESVSTAGNYIYVGEVSGDPGENLGGTLEVSTTAIPEPASLLVMTAAVGPLAIVRRRG